MSGWYEEWETRCLPDPVDPAAKREHRREYMRRYAEENRDRIREYQRRYYIEHREKWDRPKPEHGYKDCAVCGAPFYPVHFSDKYCSARCRWAAQRARRAER